MKANSIIDAKEKAKSYLNIGSENTDSHFKEALSLDNTNSSILFEYLKYLKIKDVSKFTIEKEKYKYFLDEDSCSKLGITYINHKDDISYLLDAVQKINSGDLLNVEVVRDALEKKYPKEDKEILEQTGDKRLNNLPLDDLNNDILFFLSIKIQIGKHLYLLADFELDLKNESQIFHFKNFTSYFKVYSVLLKYYLETNQRLLLFNLSNILDLQDYFQGETESMTRLNYYIDQIKINDEKLKQYSGVLYKQLINCRGENYPMKKFMDEYKPLFFETIEKILKSNCVKDLVGTLRDHYNDKDNIISINDNFINYIKNSIIFFPFCCYDTYGLTLTLNGKIMINNEFRKGMKGSYEVKNLYNFTIWIITAIHEAIGHFLKDYFYYLTNFNISEKSPKDTSKEDKKQIKEGEEEEEEEDSSSEGEGGRLVETYLFLETNLFYLCDILYILDISNWKKNVTDFAKYFNSNVRTKIIKGKKQLINGLNLSEECITLISKFGISKNELNSFKSDTGFRFKKAAYNPFIFLSERKCISHKNKLIK